MPNLHYVPTSIEQTSRQFIIPFAVADIKYNILGTPFFGEYLQNINTQDFTLQFKYQSKDQPNLLLHIQKTVHTSRTYTESILKHKYI